MEYKGIVISGLPGSGKSTLARELSNILGWQVHSIGRLFREKWENEYPNEEISFEDYWSKISREENILMNEKARKIIEKGFAIGDFRYAICCSSLPVLFVYIKADIDIRAKRTKDIYKNESIAKIKEILLSREQEELRVAKDLYGINYDFRDENNYQLILDSGILPIKEEIEIILEYLKNA